MNSKSKPKPKIDGCIYRDTSMGFSQLAREAGLKKLNLFAIALYHCRRLYASGELFPPTAVDRNGNLTNAA